MSEMLQCISMFLCRRRASVIDVQPAPPVNAYKQFCLAADDSEGGTDLPGPDCDADSFDGSDMESDCSDLMLNSEPSSVDTDSEIDFSDEETSITHNRLKARGCQARKNCPSTQRDSHVVRSIDGADSWHEQSVDPRSALEGLGSNSIGTVDSQAFGTLLHSLSLLTPEDAGRLRSWMDEHLASKQEAAS